MNVAANLCQPIGVPVVQRRTRQTGQSAVAMRRGVFCGARRLPPPAAALRVGLGINSDLSASAGRGNGSGALLAWRQTAPPASATAPATAKVGLAEIQIHLKAIRGSACTHLSILLSKRTAAASSKPGRYR
eukprot:COSAG06_NODE_345_length_17054_cov_3.313476_4_plen_131_part_00